MGTDEEYGNRMFATIEVSDLRSVELKSLDGFSSPDLQAAPVWRSGVLKTASIAVVRIHLEGF